MSVIGSHNQSLGSVDLKVDVLAGAFPGMPLRLPDGVIPPFNQVDIIVFM